MTEQTQATEVQNTQPTEDERTALENQAKILGIKFHPNIGDDKLREKVAEALNGTAKPDEDEDIQEVEPKRKAPSRSEALALVRVRVTCMNPNKKEWEGEIFCTGNSQLGTIKKYVPFEAEWHVPRVILNMIKRRQYQTFVTKKTPNGGKIKVGKLVREFAVEELAPLSEKELAELRQRQVMASGSSE